MPLAALFLLAAAQTGNPGPPPHSLAALLGDRGFVRIPAGEFTMGSDTGNPDEQPPHRVRIAAFEMSRFEVTQAQWEAVMKTPHARAADPNPSRFRGPSRPVENVAWPDVQRFIQALNVRDPSHVYRLPTEAEWEYAARAGSASLDDSAWHGANAGGETHAVGGKSPNAFGLHDMLGNVFEWVDDWYSITYEGGARGQSYKVYRGCAWLSEAKYCRPSYRGFDFPGQGYDSVGFRLVRTPV